MQPTLLTDLTPDASLNMMGSVSLDSIADSVLTQEKANIPAATICSFTADSVAMLLRARAARAWSEGPPLTSR